MPSVVLAASSGVANGMVNGAGSRLCGMRLSRASFARATRSAGSMSAALPNRPTFSRSRRLSSMIPFESSVQDAGGARWGACNVADVGVFPQLARQFKLGTEHGAWGQGVSPGGPSDRAGLHAGDHRERFQDSGYVVGGDVIASVGGHQVREEDDVAKALVQLAPGTQVDLVVQRDGSRKTLRVKLGERPLNTPRGG